ncbi:Alpha/Beta hydrolase protein [Ilyonectria robusta]|uniref:Alpha/Beta hydrolase protein n=1 Tax=Ilyonectria robusta TaxID=1079257 RepID=UPI001E8D29DD|nr:Alpha/Beta hydrolase protein [Ilyonectria robusta]KAH8688440.1 Alpha/Beta hydrolase protein [Ilyonectria robusta]
MSSDHEQPGATAIRYVSDPRFHQTLTLPATADHEALTVSFADAGRAPEPPTGPSPPTVLFMPGMFASRYLSITLHFVAQKLGVRVLVVDRPGMGKSTDVPLEQRVPVWLELVPRLLEHLGIKHVALASHSAGTIYLLNTLYHYRDILHPEKPSVTMLAPWVHPSHSRVTSMQLAQYIPASAFSVWHLIPKFFVLKAGPAFASSGAVVTKASNVISGGGQDDSELEKNRQRMETVYQLPRDVQIEIDALVMKKVFEENTVGANSEALQVLKKGPALSWGKCEDYEIFVREVVDRERNRRSAGNNEGMPKLKVAAYFAETDALVGPKGQAYMEECWKGKEEGEFGDVIDFETHTVHGADHDSVMQSAVVLEKLFIAAGGVMNENAA